MAISVEWRIHAGSDTILIVDTEAQRVEEVFTPDADVLKHYLAATADLEHWREWSGWRQADEDQRAPEDWGTLAMARSDEGDVTAVDPEVFWDGVRRWFRSRGIDYNSVAKGDS